MKRSVVSRWRWMALRLTIPGVLLNRVECGGELIVSGKEALIETERITATEADSRFHAECESHCKSR
jgi:hypothetical protein